MFGNTVRLTVRTSPFQGEDVSSILARDKINYNIFSEPFGGMVDTPDLKSGSVLGVSVQVR